MPPIEIGKGFFEFGTFSASLAMLFAKGVRYSTVIDVGCADGSFFLLHSYFGIFAGATPVNIEANPIYEESLRTIKDRAGGHFIVGAASDADGEAEMILGAHPYWSSLRVRDDPYWKQIHNLHQGTCKVRTFTIDGMAEQLGLQPPFLLKLDVQGAEQQVLRGARRVLGDTDVVICETDMSDFQSLNSLMTEPEFDLFYPMQLNRLEDHMLRWFYPVYLKRRLSSLKASALWRSVHTDQVIEMQAQRRTRLVQVNAAILAEMSGCGGQQKLVP